MGAGSQPYHKRQTATHSSHSVGCRVLGPGQLPILPQRIQLRRFPVFSQQGGDPLAEGGGQGSYPHCVYSAKGCGLYPGILLLRDQIHEGIGLLRTLGPVEIIEKSYRLLRDRGVGPYPRSERNAIFRNVISVDVVIEDVVKPGIGIDPGNGAEFLPVLVVGILINTLLPKVRLVHQGNIRFEPFLRGGQFFIALKGALTGGFSRLLPTVHSVIYPILFRFSFLPLFPFPVLSLGHCP